MYVGKTFELSVKLAGLRGAARPAGLPRAWAKQAWVCRSMSTGIVVHDVSLIKLTQVKGSRARAGVLPRWAGECLDSSRELVLPSVFGMGLCPLNRGHVRATFSLLRSTKDYGDSLKMSKV